MLNFRWEFIKLDDMRRSEVLDLAEHEIFKPAYHLAATKKTALQGI